MILKVAVGLLVKDLISERDEYGSSAGPGKVTLISPAGTISDNTPVFTWMAAAGAVRYKLKVTGPAQKVQHANGHRGSFELGLPAGAFGQCGRPICGILEGIGATYFVRAPRRIVPVEIPELGH